MCFFCIQEKLSEIESDSKCSVNTQLIESVDICFISLCLAPLQSSWAHSLQNIKKQKYSSST